VTSMRSMDPSYPNRLLRPSRVALTPAPRAPSITAVRRICRLSLVFAGSREGLTAARVPGRRGHEVRGRRLGLAAAIRASVRKVVGTTSRP